MFLIKITDLSVDKFPRDTVILAFNGMFLLCTPTFAISFRFYTRPSIYAVNYNSFYAARKDIDPNEILEISTKFKETLPRLSGNLYENLARDKFENKSPR